MGLATTTGGIGSTTSGNASEVPMGVFNGVNRTFTLGFLPVPGSLLLFVNGILQNPGFNGPADYTIIGLTITYTVAPRADDWIRASYQH